jgi:hypothetical protein
MHVYFFACYIHIKYFNGKSNSNLGYVKKSYSVKKLC